MPMMRNKKNNEASVLCGAWKIKFIPMKWNKWTTFAIESKTNIRRKKIQKRKIVILRHRIEMSLDWRHNTCARFW